ncbi:MAG: roadblock/LC7 domain-containing protein [Thermoplasmata archaeon]
MVAPDELERVLRDFNFTYGTQVAGFVTGTGVPIAIQANVEIEEEHFATMAATFVGSMDVLYRGVGLAPPERITAETANGVLTVLRVERNAFFLALGGDGVELKERSDEALEALKRVLEPLQPLEKFAL